MSAWWAYFRMRINYSRSGACVRTQSSSNLVQCPGAKKWLKILIYGRQLGLHASFVSAFVVRFDDFQERPTPSSRMRLKHVIWRRRCNKRRQHCTVNFFRRRYFDFDERILSRTSRLLNFHLHRKRKEKKKRVTKQNASRGHGTVETCHFFGFATRTPGDWSQKWINKIYYRPKKARLKLYDV